MKCEICNAEFSSTRSFSTHLKAHSITSKEYYDKYLKLPNEGICLYCGKQTYFAKLNIGYRKFCSKKCCNKSSYHISKMKSTTISRYGGMGTSSKIINEKIKNTIIQKYGSENVYASNYGKQKIKESNISKFGVEYAFQAEEVKSKIIQTSLLRYNTSNPANCRSGRQKAAFTRRSSFNDSSWEDYFEKQLSQLNITYVKRYDSDIRYPYACDFYLPALDMFIEINGYWSHGKHFFDKTNINDINTLNNWIEKSNNGHKQYTNAINVWTKKDLQKRNTAIKNNLNYIVLWTLDDLNTFFETYKKGTFKNDKICVNFR